MSIRSKKLIYLATRKLIFCGFGLFRNKLIIKSFFRRRPLLVSGKLHHILKYIIYILLENLNFVLFSTIRQKLRFDTCIAKYNFDICTIRSSTLLVLNSFLHNYVMPTSHYSQFKRFVTFCSVLYVTALRNSDTLLTQLVFAKNIYILRILRVHLYNYSFFWKVGFGSILCRSTLHTFLRSPHTDKKSRTQFSKKVYKSVLRCPYFISSTQLSLLKRFLGGESYSSIEFTSVRYY